MALRSNVAIGEGAGAVGAEGAHRCVPSPCAAFTMRLDLGVGVPARRLLLQDQVRPHAAAGEGLDALVVLGAVGVRVEVARAVVADVLEELHQEERGARVGGAEAEVLVVAARILVVQVDVEQLAGFPRLRRRRA